MPAYTAPSQFIEGYALSTSAPTSNSIQIPLSTLALNGTAKTSGVHAVTIVTAGTGYTSAPTVAFSGGGGSGATATAVVSGGSVVAVNITALGSGYTSAPTVTFSGGGSSDQATGTAVLAFPLFSNLTAAEANATTGDIRAVLFTLLDKLSSVYNAKPATTANQNGKTVKMTITPGVIMTANSNSVTRTFSVSFQTQADNEEIAPE